MFKVLIILGLEGQSLKYSVNTVPCIIYCVPLPVHGVAGFIFFGGVKQKADIRQCSQATARSR